jgi:class 3 adenylate cyclase
LLADITGYTSFLDNVRLAHEDDAFADGQIPDAYAMMSSFLEGIASVIDPPFNVVKFEGDAAFAVAPDDITPRGAPMLDLIRRCYQDFVDRRSAAGIIWTCTCNACSRRETLDLKFVVHHGEYFVQAVADQIEVVGPDVNIAHRLLKNAAAELVGSLGYSLFTDATTDALALPLTDAASVTETIDGDQPIATRVIPLRE